MAKRASNLKNFRWTTDASRALPCLLQWARKSFNSATDYSDDQRTNEPLVETTMASKTDAIATRIKGWARNKQRRVTRPNPAARCSTESTGPATVLCFLCRLKTKKEAFFGLYFQCKPSLRSLQIASSFARACLNNSVLECRLLPQSLSECTSTSITLYY